MLVLSRQRDETIMIGDDIEITVVDIRGDKVRLGITAPNTVPVHRKEVYEAIQRENREAAKVRMEDFGTLPKPGIPGKPGEPMRPGRSTANLVNRPNSPSQAPTDKGSAPSGAQPDQPANPAAEPDKNRPGADAGPAT
jgi:carbon storage regulator